MTCPKTRISCLRIPCRRPCWCIGPARECWGPCRFCSKEGTLSSSSLSLFRSCTSCLSIRQPNLRVCRSQIQTSYYSDRARERLEEALGSGARALTLFSPGLIGRSESVPDAEAEIALFESAGQKIDVLVIYFELVAETLLFPEAVLLLGSREVHVVVVSYCASHPGAVLLGHCYV